MYVLDVLPMPLIKLLRCTVAQPYTPLGCTPRMSSVSTRSTKLTSPTPTLATIEGIRSSLVTLMCRGGILSVFIFTRWTAFELRADQKHDQQCADRPAYKAQIGLLELPFEIRPIDGTTRQQRVTFWCSHPTQNGQSAFPKHGF